MKRFCPFCSAENTDEVTQCSSCKRRLPPSPPRRKRASLAIRPVSGSPALDSQIETNQLLAVHDEATRDVLPTTVAAEPSTTLSVDAAPTIVDRDAIPTTIKVETVPTIDEPDAIPTTVKSDARALLQEVEVAAANPKSGSESHGSNDDGGATNVQPGKIAGRSDLVPPMLHADTRSASSNRDRWQASSAMMTPGVQSGGSKAILPGPTAALPRPVSAAHDAEPVLPLPSHATPVPEAIVAAVSKRQERPTPTLPPLPDTPEGNPLAAVRYALSITVARWKRRRAIGQLQGEIHDDTTELDKILGALGRQARAVHLEARPFANENKAISDAEKRRQDVNQDIAAVAARKAEENHRFGEIDDERRRKVDEAESALQAAQREVVDLEGKRKGLRERRKEIERKQKGYEKSAAEHDQQALRLSSGLEQQSLRTASRDLRGEAQALEPERQEACHAYDLLDRPFAEATTRVNMLKGELDSARRSLTDAREGHRHRLSEFDAELSRKSREMAEADAEIQRRLVTLGTLANLNRVKHPAFVELYSHIDALRSIIGSRSHQVDRLTLERDAFDRPAFIRGAAFLGGLVLVLVLIVVIITAS